MPRVLVACEESQVVTKAFRQKGIEAFSCDILPCSGGHPEWHLQEDVLPLLQDASWDLILAFPPCTHLAVSGAAWFAKKREDGRQQEGINFFLRFADLPCKRTVIENPVGIMSRIYRKPDQIIQPYYFGDAVSKKTCLWLKNLPPLVETKLVEPAPRKYFKSGRSMDRWYASLWALPPVERQKQRSKTFEGIAAAMASQWGPLLKEGN